MKQMVTSLFGMFGSAVALLFGGWDIALQTLVLFMGIDWITGGILLPVIFKKSPKSETGESCGLERAVPKRNDTVVCFDRSPSGPFDGDKLSEGCRVHCVYRK